MYKNGAVVLHLDINHADILEFVTASRAELPWAKRCVNLDELGWEKATEEVRSEILAGIARGDIWPAKIRSDQYGRRIYANVCLEVFLRSRGTCLLEHINLGACTTSNMAQAFRDGMVELIDLHKKTGVEETGEYLPQDEDRQVGLGMLGLANLLAVEGVTYAEFGEALNQHLYESFDGTTTPEARKIVKALQEGIDAAAAVARMANMDRICYCSDCVLFLPLHRPSRLYNGPRTRTADRAHS